MQSPARTAPSRGIAPLLLCCVAALLLAACSDIRTPWSRTEVTRSIPPPPQSMADDRLAVASHCRSWATNQVERDRRDLRDREALDMANTGGGFRRELSQNRALRDQSALYGACMDRHAPPAPPPVEPRVVPRA